MESAFEQLIGQGVLGVFLVLVIWYFRSEIKDLKKIVAEKDKKIESLSDQSRNDAIENVSLFKDLDNTLKELVTELKINNNG